MQMTITEAAEKKLNERIAGKPGYLKLVYDIEGCGCAVSGVPTLWLVDVVGADDIELKTATRSIYMEKEKQIFFDETMSLDFHVNSNCFQLKSPGQYLNARMSLVDKTK